MSVITHLVCLYAGYLIGALMRNSVFAAMDWRYFRWDSAIMGYRVVPEGSIVSTKDKIFLATEVTSDVVEILDDKGLNHD